MATSDSKEPEIATITTLEQKPAADNSPETIAKLDRLIAKEWPNPICPTCGEQTWTKFQDTVVELTLIDVVDGKNVPAAKRQGSIEFQCDTCGFVRLHAPREHPIR